MTCSSSAGPRGSVAACGLHSSEGRSSERDHSRLFGWMSRMQIDISDGNGGGGLDQGRGQT